MVLISTQNRIQSVFPDDHSGRDVTGDYGSVVGYAGLIIT